jgi:hypothetical protein
MIKIILYVVAALGVTVGALTITGAGDDRSSTPTITTLPLSLLACNRAAEGEQSGTRVRLGEQLGRRRRGLSRVANILDPAYDRRSSRRAGLPGRRDRKAITELPELLRA